MTSSFAPSNSMTGRILTILPLTFMVVAFLLDWGWGRLPQPGRWKRLLEGEPSLLVLLGIGPFVLLAVLSQFRPILNQRGLLFASPYLLLLLSIGLVRLRNAWLGALAPILALMWVASSVSYRGMMVDPADYARFGATLQSESAPPTWSLSEKRGTRLPFSITFMQTSTSWSVATMRPPARETPEPGFGWFSFTTPRQPMICKPLSGLPAH